MTEPAVGFRLRSRLPIALIVLGAGAACVRIGNLPPMEYYTLLIEPRVDDAAPPRLEPILRGTLAIESVDTPGIYGDGGIVYRLDDSQLGDYPSRQWAFPLGDMLGRATQDILAPHRLSTESPVFDPRGPDSYTYVWRSRVLEFEEVNRGRQILAAVGLDAMLIATSSDSVIWKGSVRLERSVNDSTMTAIVRTLSDLTVDVIDRLADSARVALRVPTAAVAPPPD